MNWGYYLSQVYPTVSFITLGIKPGFWIYKHHGYFLWQDSSRYKFFFIWISSRNQHIRIWLVYSRLYHEFIVNVLELGFIPLGVSSFLHQCALRENALGFLLSCLSIHNNSSTMFIMLGFTSYHAWVCQHFNWNSLYFIFQVLSCLFKSFLKALILFQD